MATICCRSWTSVISWFFLEILNCARFTSMWNPRHNGCTRSKLTDDESWGLKLENVLFEVLRAASQPMVSDVPDLYVCSMPAVPLKERLVRVSWAPAPDRKLFGTWSLLRNCMLPVNWGSHTPREMSTSAWASCGLMRSTCTSRFCSRAIFTASSMVSRLVGPPPFCSWIGAACEAGEVAAPCPAGVGAGSTGGAGTGWAGAGWAGAGWGCAGRASPVRIRTREPPPSRAPRARLALRHQAG